MCAEAVTVERPASDARRSGEPRRAGVLFAAGAVPLAAGRLAPMDGTEIDGPAFVCPFRAATGIPCPLCGGARAIALAARGDMTFLSYGAVWPLVALVAAVGGVAGLVFAWTGRARLPPMRGRSLAVGAAAVAAVAWAYALTHADAITDT